ncbi:MAG: hypothetical protein ATN31_01470 [Candidatus Epulonipiscioides saccharophilum]|nr:MAG: hypothetical protein ATN31_01470 [Epulopiscium sp. AS2M-Bin001]
MKKTLREIAKEKTMKNKKRKTILTSIGLIGISTVILNINLFIPKSEPTFSQIPYTESSLDTQIEQTSSTEISLNTEPESIPSTKPSLDINFSTDKELFMQKGILSSYGQEEFIKFINQFYEVYPIAILNQNTSYLYNFIDNKFIDIFNKDFNSWFVDNKIIQKADISTNIKNVQMNPDNTITLDILESIYLTNNDGGNLIKYKINLLWNTNIVLIDNSFKIGIRNLNDSIVAYELDGEWIKF